MGSIYLKFGRILLIYFGGSILEGEAFVEIELWLQTFSGVLPHILEFSQTLPSAKRPEGRARLRGPIFVIR